MAVEICSERTVKGKTEALGTEPRGTLRVSVSCERENYCLTIVIDTENIRKI